VNRQDLFYVNLLPEYLTNDTLPLFHHGDLQNALYSLSRFVPKR
jgi:hypothetical protein